jgi:hypothetical protein
MLRKALVISIAFLVMGAPVYAGQLIPFPGSSPQQTQYFCFFPTPIGVTVVDDNGVPVAGEPVTFSFPVPGLLIVNGSNVFTILSNADGAAIPTIVASNLAGTFTLMASTQFGSTTFDLTVIPGGPASMTAYSGSHQTTAVGTPFAQPWIARAFDAAGNPVPYAAVQFFANPTGASVTFGAVNNGVNTLFVAADGNGFAVSPPVFANNVNGHDFGSASGFSGLNDPTPFVEFAYTNTSAKK